jgi:hypothetical protein
MFFARKVIDAIIAVLGGLKWRLVRHNLPRSVSRRHISEDYRHLNKKLTKTLISSISMVSYYALTRS